ncbi:MAG: hypothetical protein GX050_07640 [Firmicutes bacterium]|nr:hypothetical protein [Bacillota bacterium]
MKDFRLVMADGELRLRMRSELKDAIRREANKRSDKANKRVSMSAVIRDVLQNIFKTDRLKKAILDESRRRTDEIGTLVSMNAIVIEILEKVFLKNRDIL